MLNFSESSRGPDGEPFQFTTLTNKSGSVATFMDWGATWVSCQIALNDGSMREVLLGCQTPEQFTQQSAFSVPPLAAMLTVLPRLNMSIKARKSSCSQAKEKTSCTVVLKVLTNAAGNAFLMILTTSLIGWSLPMAIRDFLAILLCKRPTV